VAVGAHVFGSGDFEPGSCEFSKTRDIPTRRRDVERIEMRRSDLVKLDGID